VALDYRMRAEDGRWRIIDVFMNGTVSELALRRSEYSGLLKRQGFDALLQAIEQKIAAQERASAQACRAPKGAPAAGCSARRAQRAAVGSAARGARTRSSPGVGSPSPPSRPGAPSGAGSASGSRASRTNACRFIQYAVRIAA